MKNGSIVLLVWTVLILLPLQIHAEESPPGYLATIGGSTTIRLGGESGKIESMDFEELDIDLRVSGGYLIRDFIEVGPMLLFEFGRSMEDPSDPTFRRSWRSRIEVGPYLFFHLYRSDRIRLYAGPAVTFVYDKYENEQNHSSVSTYGDEEEEIRYGVHGILGLNYFITRSIALDFGAQLEYSEIDVERRPTSGSAGHLSERDGAGLRGGLFVGLKYYLPKVRDGLVRSNEDDEPCKYIAAVGGSTGIDFGVKEVDFGKYDHDDLHLHVQAAGGYLFENWIEVGPLLSVDYSSWTDSVADEKTALRLEIGPYAAFHLYRSRRVRFYLGPALTFLFIEYEGEKTVDYVENETSFRRKEASGFGAYGILGVNICLTRQVALDLGGRVGYRQVHHDIGDQYSWDESERSDGVVYLLFAGLKFFFEGGS